MSPVRQINQHLNEAVGDHRHDESDVGGFTLVGQNMDIQTASGTITPAAAIIYLARIDISAPQLATNVLVCVTTAGTSYTNTQLGIYSASGALLGATAVQASAGTNGFGTTGVRTIALSAPVTLQPPFVWVGLNMGTNNATAAILRGGVVTATLGANLNLPAERSKVGQVTGHASNDLATIGALTPTSIAVNGTLAPIWVAIS